MSEHRLHRSAYQQAGRSILTLGLAVCAPGVVGLAAGQEQAGRLLEPIRTAEQSVSPYIVQNWTADDGLPVNSVTAIEQTSDGYLWLGSFGGLARFDGVTFRTFLSADNPGLGDDRVLKLYEDRAGTLWIGTQGSGVFRLRDGVFSAPDWADALPRPQVSAFHEGRDGALWVSTVGGAVRVARDGRVTVLTPRGDRRAPDVLAVLDSVDGAALLGTFAGGLAGAAGEDVRTISLEKWPDADVRAVSTDATGTVWVGTQEYGLLRLVGDRLESVPLSGAPEIFPVNALLPGADGGLWIGAEEWIRNVEAGLFRLDGTSLRPFGGGEGLSSVSILALYRDREDNVWVGTDVSGLHRLTRRSAVPHVPADRPRLSFGPIVGDGAGGLWAGATCGGLVHLRDGVFERYAVEQGLPDRCIGALSRDADGTLWIAKGQGGLLRLREDRVTLLSAADGLDGNEVRAILRDRSGTLWVGTESAVNRLGPDGRFRAHRLPVQPAHVVSMIDRHDGGLWVGTGVGVFRFADGVFTRWDGADAWSHGMARDLLEDPDGTLWVATYGGGLHRLRDGRVTHYTTSTGMFDMFLSRILDDGLGRLWLSSNRGVFSVARAELDAVADGRASAVTSVWFDSRDGMPSSETNGGGQPAGWHAPDGRLWFPTVDGLVSFDPAMPRNPHPPPVVISRLVVDRQPMADLGLAPALGRPSGPIELPAGTHSLEIHYAGLSYRAPEKLHFRYRLAGYDDTWIDAGARREAYYTGLPPGRYRFLVRARNEDGVWSETVAALPIRQVPYVYQTWWFLALSAGLLLALAVAGHRLRLRGLVRRNEELEARVAARTVEVVGQRDQLAEKHETVEKAHGDLLAILDQSGVGVCLIDGAGVVEFLSVAAEAVLGCSTAEASGRPWQELLPLSAADLHRAEVLLTEPAVRRARLPVRLDTADERRYWIELDACDDPRDASHRMLFLRDASELYDLPGLVDDRSQFQGMVGETAGMRVVYRKIRDVATVDSTVILEGETGTGKELAARAIHDLSARRGRPYVAVNCAGLTESLLSSQLFGHRRGAFTGAVADQTGLFEAAAGGTLLLDEVGDISPSVQASLLRVLQEGEITRVGESRPRKIDVRVVAATHRDLDAEVAAGRFRQDLFYRLRVARIRIPPLRERRDDIPLLVAWFLGQARAIGHVEWNDVSRQAMDLLLAHPWPGNVRELQGVVESAALTAEGEMIEVVDLPSEFLASAPDLAMGPIQRALNPHQRRQIQAALEYAGGNRAAAARLMGVSRSTFYRRLQELDIKT